MASLRRANNYDFLRIFLAFSVVLAHVHLITDTLPWPNDEMGRLLSGLTGVECFFVVSGFLIFMSYDRSTTLRRYMEKRFRRIFPAYLFVVALSATVGSMLTVLSLGDYLRSGEFWRYLVSNSALMNFIQPTLPGVFQNAEGIEQVVNGPLWSIKVEFLFYLSVPIVIWLARKVGMVKVFAAIYVASLVWKMGFNYLADETGREAFVQLAQQTPGQMSFFVAGAILYHRFEWFQKNWRPLVYGAVPILIAYFSLWDTVRATYVLYPAALAVVVIAVGSLAPYLGNFGRYGDISYGVYIFHYPVFRVLEATRPFGDLSGLTSDVLNLVTAIVIVLALSFFSWHFIEKRFLLRTSHYILSEGKSADQPQETGQRAS